MFRKLNNFPCSSERVGERYSVGYIRKTQVVQWLRTQQSCLPLFHLRTETDLVAETLYASEYWSMDKVKKKKT
jgi:hypothetical protein